MCWFAVRLAPSLGRAGEHRYGTAHVGAHEVLSGVISLLRAIPGGWDIVVDSLAPELVIDGCLIHGVTLLGASSQGVACTGVWTGCGYTRFFDLGWLTAALVRLCQVGRSTAVQRCGP
jgi:hypothetical protein